MKKILKYTVLGLFCIVATASATAREKKRDGRIEAHDVAVAYAGGKITVSMHLDATGAALQRTEAIVLTPVIRAEGHERELTPVIVSGHNRKKSDRRAAYFNRSIPYDAASATAPSLLPYVATTTYEPWMADASLALKEDIYGCAMKHLSEGSVVLMALPPAEPVKPAVTYIDPVAEPVKNRHMSGRAFLDFPAGRAVVLSDFRDNARELGKIRAMIDRLRGDKDVIIDSIVLRGYASPEGSYATNKHLAMQRSEALRNYLQKESGYPASMFHAGSGAEDWAGLRALVEKSDIADRDAILAVIDSDANPDNKEHKIKALSSYPELLRDYFPKLRRVEYRLCYTVRAFSVEEGRKKIRTDPGLMSLNEMFLIANSYPRGSDEFKQAFDTAVRIFPADTVANLNEAAMLLERGDAAAARLYLEPYAADPVTWNNLGVMYLLEGDYVQARTFFDKASGVSESARNLELLSRLEAYEKMKAGRSAPPK